MRIRRRHLRRTLVLAGCVVGQPVWPFWALGVGLLAAGGGLHLWCKGHLEQNRLVTTSGPYRYSRNPFYLANLLIDLGLLFVIGELWVAGLYLPVWIYAYHQTILGEEAHLRALFGAEFERYVARVPRLLPFRKPLPAASGPSGFDWANPSLANGREYARLMGVALSAAAIAVAYGVREAGPQVFAHAADPTLYQVGLLGVAWIVKLGLAEAMRRPELALVPSRAGAAARSLWLAFALAPLGWLAFRVGEDVDGLLWNVLGVAALVTPWLGWPSRTKAWLLGGLSLCVAGQGAVSAEGWIACWPMLWISLYALDELARARLGGEGKAMGRELWSFFMPIGAGASAFCLVAAGARFLLDGGFG